MRTVGVRAAGNLDTDISMIYVDLRYVDEKNNYIKTTSVALSKAQPFFDWNFPVIDANGGTVFYSANIQYKDGRVDEIKQQTAATNTFMVGEKIEDVTQVRALANLIDFTKVALIQLSLHYSDPANQVDERQDIVFDSTTKVPQSWTLPLKDKTKTKYNWQATYYMADGSTRSDHADATDALTIVLRVPAA